MRKFLKVSAATLFAAGSLGCGGSAYAYYAQLTAPAGWSQGAGAVATYNTAKTAAQVASVELGRIAANAALTVNGKSVPIPAKLPLGPGAARVAAAAIYLHPGLRAAAAVAAWTGAAGLAYNVATGLWERLGSEAEVSDGFEYGVDGVTWYPSRESACSAATIVSATVESASLINSGAQCEVKFHYNNSPSISRSLTMNVGKRASSCPAGWYKSPAGCTQAAPMEPVTKEEFEQMVPDARPMPPELPGIVWPASWPVTQPEIQPMFVPTGNPVPNPNYDPAKPQSPTNQPYNQPGVRVVPAPTADNPWQVDVQPVNRPTDSPIAKPEPTPDVLPDGTPIPDPGDTQREPDPEKILTCGLPDTPACLIEEKGTPEPVEDTAQKDAERVHKPLDDLLKDPKSVLPSFPTINWTFTLPSGCAPLSIPAFAPFLQEIDVCQFQPIFHDIMSMIWIGGALFGAIGTFWRNVFAKAG